MSDRDRKLEDLRRDRTRHEGRHLTTDQGVGIEHTDEAFEHGKPIAAIGEGIDLIRQAPVNGVRVSDDRLVSDAGVVTLATATNGRVEDFVDAIAEAVKAHRHFDRQLELVPA